MKRDSSEFWVQTYTGRRFNFVNPRPGSVCLTDIAYSLGMQARWNGHAAPPISVARHSIQVSNDPMLNTNGERLWGLMHDSAEAYIGDISSPLKAYFRETWPPNAGPDPLEALEGRVLEVIAEALSLPPLPIPDSVLSVDGAERYYEWGARMERTKRPLFTPWSPADDAHEFVRRFHELKEAIGRGEA